MADRRQGKLECHSGCYRSGQNQCDVGFEDLGRRYFHRRSFVMRAGVLRLMALRRSRTLVLARGYNASCHTLSADQEEDGDEDRNGLKEPAEH